MATLRDIARKDAQAILEDPKGLSLHAMFTAPTGETAAIVGWYNDVPVEMDIDSGMAVMAGGVSFAVCSRTIESAIKAGSLPAPPREGWKVDVQTEQGARAFYIANPWHDETIGVIVYKLQERRRG
jgi:hypothetical protein